MASLIGRCWRAASRLGPLRRVANAVSYPHLGIARSVNLNVTGRFSYGRGCVIGEGSNILVPSDATLSLGTGSYIGRFVELGPGGGIEIGDDTSVQDRCILLGEVQIGRYCRFAPNVFISSGRHYFDLHPTWLIRDQDELVARDAQLSGAHHAPVRIEDDCWLGINSVVMRGVTIGKGAIVGAGSIVTADVPPYAIVAGAPAKVVRKRFEFSPPRHLDHADERHWPYFYSGFEMSQVAMRRFSALGGIGVRGEFELCLDTAAAGALHVLARNAGAGQAVMSVAGERRELGPEFSEIVFGAGGARGVGTEWSSPIRGAVAAGEAGVVVREVWIA